MLFTASHIAIAPSAATDRFNRPGDWRFVCARAYLSSSKPMHRAGQGSIGKPE
jgi:hypothetical protein